MDGSTSLRERILVVDDNAMNRDMLSRRLERQGYRVATAEDGSIALERVREGGISLVLLDVMMPRIDGYEVLRQMKAEEALRNIPIVVVTAVGDSDSAARCIASGAEDYLVKPFDPVLLKARVNSCLERKRLLDRSEEYRLRLEESNVQLGERIREQVMRISSGQQATIFAMSKLAESRDPETGAHLDRVREYCRVLADALSKRDEYRSVIDRAFVETIYAASPLHDIGKVGVPDQVLLKPGKLDPDEWRLMQMHAAIGAMTLRAVEQQHPGNAFIAMGIEIAEAHHERWDGRGYPYGRVGTAIPLAARIIALGDVYDALTSRRCYKEAFSHERSRQVLLDERGHHLDPDVVDAFVRTEDQFVDIRARFQDPSQ